MRTVDEFLQYVAAELVWRRKELTQMRALVQSAQGDLRQKALIRASVAILYAHWEGFVKSTGSAYLKYVANQGVECNRLSYNFLALASKAFGADQDGFQANLKVATYYSENMGRRARVPYKGVVNTRSNLGSSVLRELLAVLGLPDEPFSTKFAFIDSSLVNRRNHIAHGEYLDIDPNEYEDIHQEVLGLIEAFRNEVENAVVTKRYLRPVAHPTASS